jgi:DNA adenine methylase
MKIDSFLKWAGGKSKLLPFLFKNFPKKFDRFVEPFFGGGTVGLNVDCDNCIVNDINPDLIAAWVCLQQNNFFIEDCKKLFVPENKNREAYDALRAEFNTTTDWYTKATLFLYLNRHGYNGLCRYNSKGIYNVPVGDGADKDKDVFFPQKEMEECKARIQNFKILNTDFRSVFEIVEKGDLVYCDPPFFPMSDTASFSKYAQGDFSFVDQFELAQCAVEAARKGATVIISNHCNWYSRQMYEDMFFAKIKTVDSARTISSDTKNRKSVKELIAIFLP